MHTCARVPTGATLCLTSTSIPLVVASLCCHAQGAAAFAGHTHAGSSPPHDGDAADLHPSAGLPAGTAAS